MATNRQTLLLHTADIDRATTEINVFSGAITVRLSDVLFLASMPTSFNTSLLQSSSLITSSLGLDETSITMLNAWRIVEEKYLLNPVTPPLGRRISLERRGIAVVALVMETDISSSALPYVIAGAHSLAENYASLVVRNKLTIVLKLYHINSDAPIIPRPPSVPPQGGAAPALRVPSTSISSWPSAVNFNDKIYCFYRGHNLNANFLFYKELNGNTWGTEQQVPGVITSEGPSAIMFQNKIYCFKQGHSSRNEIWYASFDGETWDDALQVPNTRITAGPSVVVFNNKLYCFHQGFTNPDHALWFNVFDGKTWEGDKIVSGVFMTGSPSTIVFNNLIYCFYQGVGIYEKVLMVCVLNPESQMWSKERQVPNSKPMSQGPATVVVNGMLYCFHQGESAGELYVNVSSDGVEWGEDTLVDDVSLCEGLAAINYGEELYYFFQKGEGGEVTNGELWYRRLKLVEEARFKNRAWEISMGEPSLEELGFEPGYTGFITLANTMRLEVDSASYGYVVYITGSPLLYDAYADEIRMCLHYMDPSYIHYRFVEMFSVEGSYDQRLVSSNVNYPPRPVDRPSYTLAWVSDWQDVLDNAILIVFYRANDTTNTHLWLLFLDKRNSRWVEMEGPKMSFRALTLRGSPAPQFGSGFELYVFYHADANSQEMRYNVLGVTNNNDEKTWDVEKVMHGIPAANSPSAICMGQYMHVFRTLQTNWLWYASLDTRFNQWAEGQIAFRVTSSPSAVLYRDQIYLFYRDTTLKLAVSVWDKDRLTWNQSNDLNAASTHTLNGDPTAVVHGDVVYVFYVSTGPSIWWNRFDGNMWRGPTQVEMSFSNVNPPNDGVAAYTWGDDIHCFFRGRNIADGKMVFYKVFNTIDFTWNDEAILPTASGFSGKPSVILNHLLFGA